MNPSERVFVLLLSLAVSVVGCSDDVPCYADGSVRSSEGCACPEGTRFAMKAGSQTESECVPTVASDADTEEVPGAETSDGGERAVRSDGGSTSAPSVDMDATRPDAASAVTCVPSNEVCDGQDNDCDGAVDEGVLNACGACGVLDHAPGDVCTAGDGDCMGQGTWECTGPKSSSVRCNAVAKTKFCGTCGPVPAEVCDGADNDCDGMVDEGVTKNACGGCSTLAHALGDACYVQRARCNVVGAYACAASGTIACSSSTECATAVSAYAGETHVGVGFTCSIYSDGSLQCWGKNDYGQLGNGTTLDSPAGVNVKLPGKVLRLYGGNNFVCAYVAYTDADKTGVPHCWGANYDPLHPGAWTATPVVLA